MGNINPTINTTNNPTDNNIKLVPLTFKTDPIIKDMIGQNNIQNENIYKDYNNSDLTNYNKNNLFKEILNDQIQIDNQNIILNNCLGNRYIPYLLQTFSKNYLNIIVDFSPSTISNTLDQVLVIADSNYQTKYKNCKLMIFVNLVVFRLIIVNG